MTQVGMRCKIKQRCQRSCLQEKVTQASGRLLGSDQQVKQPMDAPLACLALGARMQRRHHRCDQGTLARLPMTLCQRGGGHRHDGTHGTLRGVGLLAHLRRSASCRRGGSGVA